MTILWCGGEEIDFPDRNGYQINSSLAVYRRSDYSRAVLEPTVIGSYLKSDVLSSFTSAWLSFYAYSYYWGNDDRICAGFYNSSSGAFIGIGASDSSGVTRQLAIVKWDGTTHTTLAKETGASMTQNCKKVDMQLINYGSNGTVNVYIDSNLVATYTGDLTVLSETDLDQLYFIGASSAAHCCCMLSEIIVADEDTRLMSLKTLVPNAAGDVNQWEGTYTNIDEVTLSDADTVYTDTVEEDVQFNLTGMPAGNFICKAVKVAARVSDGVGGIGMQMGIKTNSAIHLGNTYELEGSWETIEELYTQNPETSNRFTPAEIEALQIAFRSKSTA